MSNFKTTPTAELGVPDTAPSEKFWLKISTLALLAFIFNTTEFLPIALLTDIGQSFHMSTAHVGIMLTIYAWMVALLSLPLMLLTRNIERKKLLVWIMAIFILSHVISSCAVNFAMLIVGRIGIATAHALFWSITPAIAIRVAPKDKRVKALSLLSTGTVLALVLGIPLGRLIGELLNWRISFALIGLAALMLALVLFKMLPKVPAQNTGSLHSVAVFATRPTLLALFTITVLVITAQFTAYSYIEPFALNIGHLHAHDITRLLFIYGAAGILGAYFFGRLGEHHAKYFLVGSILVLAFCMASMLFVASSTFLFAVICVFWGAAIMSFGLILQSKVLQLASDATDVAMAIYSSLYNVGIGAGAFIGSNIILYWHLQYIGVLGGLLALAAFGAACWVIQQVNYSSS